MVPGGSAGHLDWHGHHGSMTLDTYMTPPPASARTLVTTEATDINTGSCSFSRALDRDLALGHSSGQIYFIF